MTYKEKLVSLLKTNEEVKKDLEELKFGTEVETKYFKGKIFYYDCDKYLNNLDYGYFKFTNGVTVNKIYVGNPQDYKIIGNPLEEKHLRIYCKSNGIRFNTQENDVILLRKGSANETYFGFQGSKSFDMQSDEVYEKIFNFLNENKNEYNTNR